MNIEIQTFIAIWLTAIASLVYCHHIAARIHPGPTRLFTILPIIYLFTILPLRLSSLHLGVPTIFYLVWLGNFKLLLFSFNQGPLSSTSPLSLLHFISIGLLPIKPKTLFKGTQLSSKTDKPIPLPIKCGLLASIVYLYRFRDSLHPYLILALYCFHLYLVVELILIITAVPVRAALGLEIEPQFDAPYLATSLQDFWGRRWNLMVTSIARPSVFYPVRRFCTRTMGYKSAFATAAISTFLVSGLMHELLYYYLSRASPTWEVTWFFVLHGFCVSIEMGVKKVLTGRGWRLHRAVSGLLTLGFVMITGGWLFFPQIIRNGLDLRIIDEITILVSFVREKFRLCMDLL